MVCLLSFITFKTGYKPLKPAAEFQRKNRLEREDHHKNLRVGAISLQANVGHNDRNEDKAFRTVNQSPCRDQYAIREKFFHRKASPVTCTDRVYNSWNSER